MCETGWVEDLVIEDLVGGRFSNYGVDIMRGKRMRVGV
jgi:hypothetical protein